MVNFKITRAFENISILKFQICRDWYEAQYFRLTCNSGLDLLRPQRGQIYLLERIYTVEAWKLHLGNATKDKNIHS